MSNSCFFVFEKKYPLESDMSTIPFERSEVCEKDKSWRYGCRCSRSDDAVVVGGTDEGMD